MLKSNIPNLESMILTLSKYIKKFAILSNASDSTIKQNIPDWKRILQIRIWTLFCNCIVSFRSFETYLFFTLQRLAWDQTVCYVNKASWLTCWKKQKARTAKPRIFSRLSVDLMGQHLWICLRNCLVQLVWHSQTQFRQPIVSCWKDSSPTLDWYHHKCHTSNKRSLWNWLQQLDVLIATMNKCDQTVLCALTCSIHQRYVQALSQRNRLTRQRICIEAKFE